MKLKIYLDTSIFSAYFDDRAPDRRAQTEEFWARMPAFESSTSELTREELEKTPDAVRRTKLLNLLDSLTLYPVTEEIEKLAQDYLTASVLSHKSLYIDCHSGLDPESRNFKDFWMPAFAGMTVMVVAKCKEALDSLH